MKTSSKVLSAIIAILAIAAIGLFSYGNPLKANMKQGTASNIERYKVKRGQLTLTAVGSGKIVSSNIKTIVPSGNITEITVKVGDTVKSGDILAKYMAVTGEEKQLKADSAGVVTAVPGGGANMTLSPQASSTFEISDTNKLEMNIQATEKDIYKIKTGQKASIYIDALNLNTGGSVSRVSRAGNTSGDLSVYNVTVSINKKNSGIFLGMTGSAKIEIESKKDVVKIPVEALIEKDSKRYVLKSTWLNHMNKPQADYYVEVKTGLSDADYVEITKGNINNMEILIVPKTPVSMSPFGG